MNILHASTDPTLLARLKEMLGSSSRADIAVGYFFMSGFERVADDLAGGGEGAHPGGPHGPAGAGASGGESAAGAGAAGAAGS